MQRTVSFPLSGVDATPGVITMVLRGRGDTVVVVFNATATTVTQRVPGLGSLTAVPSVDPAMAAASYNGTMFSVPARTVAVFR